MEIILGCTRSFNSTNAIFVVSCCCSLVVVGMLWVCVCVLFTICYHFWDANIRGETIEIFSKSKTQFLGYYFALCIMVDWLTRLSSFRVNLDCAPEWLQNCICDVKEMQWKRIEDIKYWLIEAILIFNVTTQI